MVDLSKLEKKLGVKFHDRALLDCALVHRSYLNEHGDKLSNERLEFLGDAVLELVVTAYLFERFPTKDEGVLTSFRSAVVRGANLAQVGKKIGIGDYLYLSKGEEASGGRNKHYILANTVEATIGAIFLDHGFDVSKKFIQEWILVTLEEIISDGLYLDAKTHFQERSQELENVTPHYKVLREVGPDHAKVFTVGIYIGQTAVAEGTGASKQEAEESAARAGLNVKGWL